MTATLSETGTRSSTLLVLLQARFKGNSLFY